MSDNPTPPPEEGNPEESALPFEQALAELESIVERMESGELSLEDSLSAFEQGVRLTRSCQQALAAAELRVEQLLKDGQRAPSTTGDDNDE